MTFPTYSIWKKGKKGVYHYSFFYPSKKRHRGSTRTNDKQLAKIYTEDIIRRTVRVIAEDGFNPAKEDCFSVFERFREEKSKGAARVKDGTLLLYDSYAKRFMATFGQDFLLSHLTKRQVEKYRDDMMLQKVNIKGRKDSSGKQKTFSPKTVIENMAYIASVQKHFGLDNICAGVKRPKRDEITEARAEKCYSLEEIKTLLADAWEIYEKNRDVFIFRKKENYWRHYYWWLFFFVYTGVEISCAEQIKFKDMHKEQCKLRVIRSKLSRARTLNLLPPARSDQDSELIGILNTTRGHNSWLAITVLESFAKEYYKRQNIEISSDMRIFIPYSGWLYKRLMDRCKKCEISTEDRGVHTLRHFYVSQALKKNPIHIVSKFIGHKDIRTTYTVYGHLLDDQSIDYDLDE